MSTLTTEDFAGFHLPKRGAGTTASDTSGGRDLVFFSRKNKNGSWLKCGHTAVVYGLNGAGKSTIGKALQQDHQMLDFIYLADGKVTKKRYQTPLENVFVFNDEYVSKNLSVSSHVDSIVLLGEKVEIEHDLERAKQDRETAEANLQTRVEKLAEAKKAEDAAKEIWTSKLREDGGWASREGKIHGTNPKRVTRSVQSSILEKLDILPGNYDVDTAKSSFEKELTVFEAARGKQESEWKAPLLEEKFNPNAIANTLSRISPIGGDAIEGSISERIASERLSVAELRERRRIISEKARTHCSTCFQILSESVIRDTLSALDAEIDSMERDVLADEARKLKSALYGAIEPPEKGVISSALEQELAEALACANEAVKEINECIEAKASNPRIVVDVDLGKYQAAHKSLVGVLTEIDSKVDGYNLKIRESDDAKRKLSELNLKMAIAETASEARTYRQRREEVEENEKALRRAEKALEDVETSINKLTMELKNETEAVPKVNALLEVVFGEGRLALEPEEGGYATSSNGQRVEAKNLSTGEKNILALCYFFVSMASENVYEDSFGSERLIVLDDPISSFDRSNKYGALALIALIANQNMVAGSKTRLLVMTHDLEVAFDLSKLFNQLAPNVGTNHTDLEYRAGELAQSDFSQVNEYQRLLRKAYKVAFEGGEIEELPSNDLRRLYEAFVTFNLDMKITEASSESLVADFIASQGEGGKRFKDTYLSRVFINPGSHSEMNVRISDYKLLNELSREDRKRFVIETLIFMHLLAPLHIPSQVSRKKEEQARVRQRMESEVERRMSER